MKSGVLQMAFALLAITALGPRPAGADGSSRPQPPAVDCGVTAGDGEARATPAEAWRPLARGARTPARGQLRAGAGPLRLCLSPGVNVELAAGTTMGLFGEAQVAVPGGGRVAALDVHLEAGEIFVPSVGGRWTGRLTRPLLVRGAGAERALHLRGGLRARVWPQEKGPPALAVAAYDSEALVSGPRSLRSLRAGSTVVLRAAEDAAPAHPLPAPPAWIADDGPRAPGPLALVDATESTAAVAARFAAVPDAAGYEADIARDAAFTDLAARVSLAAAEHTLATQLPAGRYFARVSSRTAEGLRGHPGAIRLLRVVRATFAQGGGLVGGIAALPPSRVLHLEDPEGLEVSRGAAPFASVGPDLGLDAGSRPVDLRLRLAGEGSFLPLAVVPLALHAEVELGPKTATWPQDPVWILVRVSGPDRSVIAFDQEVRVTVNLQDVAVTWQREGAALRAVLPPRAGAGPWAVRAEVRDLRGKEIGFGALEVIRRGAP